MNLTELERPENATPKQFLVDLQDEGRITSLQLRSAAKRLDALVESGEVDDPLGVVLEELETGEVKVDVDDPEADDDLPRLPDIGDEHSSKQKLLILREAGSLSPEETRIAARALDRGQTIEQALAEADAERLLETAPAATPDVDFSELTIDELEEVLGDHPDLINEAVAHELVAREEPRVGALETIASAEKDRDEPRDHVIEQVEAVLEQESQEDAGDSGQEPEDAGDSEEEPEDSEGPRTLKDVVELNLDDMEDAVEQIQSKDAILELLRLEHRNKNRDGGKDILVERARDLGATDEEVMDAFQDKSTAEAAEEAENRIDDATS